MRLYICRLAEEEGDVVVLRRVGDGGNNFFAECLDEQATRLNGVNAALEHIEEGCLIELPDGRTMRRFDIIGIDDELRLRAKMCRWGEEEIAVGLRRLGRNGVVNNLNGALKSE